MTSSMASRQEENSRASPMHFVRSMFNVRLSAAKARRSGALASVSTSQTRELKSVRGKNRRTTRNVGDIARKEDERRTNARASADDNDRDVDHGRDISTFDKEDKPMLICAFDVVGATAAQEAMIREAMTLKPNYSYRVREVVAENESIMNLGIFKSVRCLAKDSRDGLRVTFEVVPYEIMRGLEFYGLDSVPAKLIEDTFKPQMGKPMNSKEIVGALENFKAYNVNTRRFGEATIEGMRMIDDTSDGILRLEFIETSVDGVTIEIDPSVDPKTGKENKVVSKVSSIMPYFEGIAHTKCLNGDRLREAVDRFRAQNPRFGEPRINLLPTPGKPLGHRTFVVQLKEKAMRGITCGGGMSARGLSEGIFSGLAGHFSAFHTNLFGTGKMSNFSIEATPRKGGRGLTVVRPHVNLSFSDPWVGFGPARTSRTLSFRSDSNSMRATHGVPSNAEGDGTQPDITAPGLSDISLQKHAACIEHSRPLLNGWTGTFAVDFKSTSVLDNDGQHSLLDAYGAPVTFSGLKYDTAFASQLRFTYSGANSAHLMLSAEQALPVQPQWLKYTRVVAKAKRSFDLLNLKQLPGPMQLVLSSKGGSVFGDLPPYEAFAIGGTSSVRGYNDGSIGTGRKYVVGSAEYRLPIRPGITGALFFDYGSDLHSGSSVLGDPAGTRGKPGSGFAYGGAALFETGGLPIRFDYAMNHQGNARFHFSLARDFI